MDPSTHWWIFHLTDWCIILIPLMDPSFNYWIPDPTDGSLFSLMDPWSHWWIPLLTNDPWSHWWIPHPTPIRGSPTLLVDSLLHWWIACTPDGSLILLMDPSPHWWMACLTDGCLIPLIDSSSLPPLLIYVHTILIPGPSLLSIRASRQLSRNHLLQRSSVDGPPHKASPAVIVASVAFIGISRGWQH